MLFGMKLFFNRPLFIHSWFSPILREGERVWKAVVVLFLISASLHNDKALPIQFLRGCRLSIIIHSSISSPATISKQTSEHRWNILIHPRPFRPLKPWTLFVNVSDKQGVANAISDSFKPIGLIHLVTNCLDKVKITSMFEWVRFDMFILISYHLKVPHSPKNYFHNRSKLGSWRLTQVLGLIIQVRPGSLS